jgi:hypothetical protein
MCGVRSNTIGYGRSDDCKRLQCDGVGIVGHDVGAQM